MRWRLCLAVMALWLAGSCHAAEVRVAVAANFSAAMQKIALAFEAETSHKAVLAFGASGALYAQIKNGAPFHVFLSADHQAPTRLQSEGLAVARSQFTYAVGRLVLWSRQPGLVDAQGEVLRTGTFDKIAVANPKIAPYGAAAMEAMARQGVLEQLRPRFVQGDSIAQTYQFVATGNAQLGFVALSQVMNDGRMGPGSAWIVPATLHTPLQQDAVLLMAGQDNPAAHALLQFLQGAKAASILRTFGYER